MTEPDIPSEHLPAIIVITTCDNRAEADAIAAHCVREQLAACVHIDAIDSTYMWQGELRAEPEFRLVIKATAGAYNAIEQAIAMLHSYDEPAIACIPITGGSASYLQWIAENSRPPLQG